MPEAGWTRVASVSDVAEGQMHAVRVGEREIALYHLPDGTFHATDNICSHEYAQLTDGWLEGDIIECPLHAGQFNVRNGQGQGAPIDTDLRTFEVRVEDGEILIALPD